MAENPCLTHPPSPRDCKIFVLDTATRKIVTKQSLPARKVLKSRAQRASLVLSIISFSWACRGPVPPPLPPCTGPHTPLRWGLSTVTSMDPFSGLCAGDKVTSGSLRRSFTCMTYSADGQWLYAGTTSGDIVTVNVARRTMQMTHPTCSAGVGALNLTSLGRLIVGGGSGSLTLFTNGHLWKDITPFTTVPGPITSASHIGDGSGLMWGQALV